MSRERQTIEAAWDYMVAATAELGAVARSEQNQQHNQVAAWLGAQFIDI